MHEKQTYIENYIETMFEIGRTVDYFLAIYDWSPWENSKDLYWDARNWAHEFEKQYDDNGDYYGAIYEFVRKKVNNKFKEYYEKNR